MPHDDKDKQVVQGHGNHDAQENRLPAVVQLLSRQKVRRLDNLGRDLHSPLTLNTDIRCGGVAVRRYRKNKVAVVYRAGAELATVPGDMAFHLLAPAIPVDPHIVQQRIADFQHPVNRLSRHLNS